MGPNVLVKRTFLAARPPATADLLHTIYGLQAVGDSLLFVFYYFVLLFCLFSQRTCAEIARFTCAEALIIQIFSPLFLIHTHTHTSFLGAKTLILHLIHLLLFKVCI